MKNLALMSLLILGGCATPLEDLYQQRGVCLAHGQSCDELQEEIEKREALIDRRAINKIDRCPGKNSIEYCDRHMRGCGNKWRRMDDQFACISPGHVSDMFQF